VRWDVNWRQSLRPSDETAYRQSAAFRQFRANRWLLKSPDSSWYDGQGRNRLRVCPSVPILRNYAALGLISNVFAFAVFGIVSCRTPFFKVAVVFSASILAGRSTIRRIWFEQNSE
jgi:hypothetical protein